MPQHDQITVIKNMDYRGTLEEWSNSYSLTGTTPTNDAGWKALADAIIASEKTCYRATVKAIRALGYVAGGNAAVWSYDYLGANQAVLGTLPLATGEPQWAGDQAGWIRARTGSSASGKPKYIRKYLHGGSAPSGQPDNCSTGWKTASLAHANLMVGGTLPGTMKWCGPGGVVGTGPSTSTYVTTRTLKRRGRRPTLPLPPV